MLAFQGSNPMLFAIQAFVKILGFHVGHHQMIRGLELLGGSIPKDSTSDKGMSLFNSNTQLPTELC